eukprot:6776343-Prorocentrum_lima.AAC.1
MADPIRVVDSPSGLADGDEPVSGGVVPESGLSSKSPQRNIAQGVGGGSCMEGELATCVPSWIDVVHHVPIHQKAMADHG